MEFQKINIHDAKTNLSAMLMQIEKTGRPVIICRNGKPIAELGPYKPRPEGFRSKVHPVMSQIKIDYDPVEDMPDDEWGPIE